MELLFKIAVFTILGLIIASLASSIFFLAKDQGKNESNRTVTALTIRVTLSIALFALLIVGYLTGVIEPHGIQEGLRVR